ncbi:hypothetical protein F5876DRAFT_76992 [Lentinula aff. lateritia]|uniref:Uncharacterized protein n=1 Tax=Lentinula aff. lateritia TaxID=2804960 RepID=A0ACC1TZP7_9AGAR|nr:hypothetical protein F5876DRAFT_76992 [Lentinula aff. lateritia]
MALPYYGAGNWEDLVPAVPSLDQLMQEWDSSTAVSHRVKTRARSRLELEGSYGNRDRGQE